MTRVGRGVESTSESFRHAIEQASRRWRGENDSYTGRPTNGGVHISMYVDDLGACYDRADALGLAFVNYRFKRRAHTKAEALHRACSACWTSPTPMRRRTAPIVQIERDIRSCVKTDGSKRPARCGSRLVNH